MKGQGVLRGIPAAAGIAFGPAFVYRRVEQAEPRRTAFPAPAKRDPAAELERLEQAREISRSEIQALFERARQRVGSAEAAIFEAHLLFVDDPSLVDTARQAIEAGSDAESAWQNAIEQAADMLESLDDPLFRARAADIRDVGGRVLRHLTGQVEALPQLDHPAIVVAADLAPSDTIQLNPDLVMAFCTAGGGPTSHAAILARAMGKPAVVGLGPALLDVPDEVMLLVDGEAGTIEVAPETTRLAELDSRRSAQAALREAQARSALEPAITRDGRRVEVVANVGDVTAVGMERALAQGAEGVGLLRTEFLFMDRPEPPSEAEQAHRYGELAEILAGRPLIVRTLDIGGDKPVPYMDAGTEANPFLGVRGIRLTLAHADLFLSQLRAVLRAGSRGRVLVMFPMVATVDEIRAARALLEQARLDLKAEGVKTGLAGVGIMVEIPAAALLADRLAAEVDFFSLGTNDLSQYTMAADRGNSGVASLADGLHPAVLRLIDATVRGAHAAGKWVGVCGELGGDTVATPILVGLGIDELSANPVAIPAVKAAVRSFDATAAQALARQALELSSAQEVRELIRNWNH